MNSIVTLAALVVATAIAAPALATDTPDNVSRANARVAFQLEQRDGRIDARLERCGERLERRFIRRAECAQTLGNDRLAAHLRARGAEVARQLDRREHRIHARLGGCCDPRGEHRAWHMHRDHRFNGGRGEHFAWHCDSPRSGARCR